MNSYPLNNPMIKFLKDLREHSKLFDQYTIKINYSLGFCKSCKSHNYTKIELACLSGGRYCAINSDIHSYKAVLETLR